MRDQEANILQLGERLREEGKATEMTNLIQKVRAVLKYMSKAKAAKLVRGLVDMFLEMKSNRDQESDSGEREVQLCKVRIEIKRSTSYRTYFIFCANSPKFLEFSPATLN